MLDSLGSVGNFVAHGGTLMAQETLNSAGMTITCLFFTATSSVGTVYHAGRALVYRDSRTFRDFAEFGASTVLSSVQAVGWGVNTLFLGVPTLAFRTVAHWYSPPLLRPMAPPPVRLVEPPPMIMKPAI